MGGGGNSPPSGDKANGSQGKESPSFPVLSHDAAISSQEKDSSSASLQQNNGEEILGLPNEASRESRPSEPSPPLKPASTSSSPRHSNAPLEGRWEEDARQLMKDILQKPFRRRKGHSDKEWTFYPSSGLHTYHTGKKCVFDGLHLRNKTSASERTLEKRTGKKKYGGCHKYLTNPATCQTMEVGQQFAYVTEIDSRNGIPMVTPGDNPYACPEQSRDFHKMGSTMPPVNFGSAMYKKKADTFIPLQHLPAVSCVSVPFHVKEKQQELEREKLEVKNLNFWKPAPTLLQTLFAAGPGRRMTLY